MKDNSDLINPVEFIGFGQCPICGSLLRIIDSEIIDVEVNKNGEPIESEVKFSKQIAHCINCDYSTPMGRYGFGYKPLSEVSMYLQKDKISKAIEKTVDNPFQKKENE